jgi:hypothetical protein
VFFGGDTAGPLDPIASECILSALRDRLQGRYEVGYVGYTTHVLNWVRLYLADDGTRRVALHSEPSDPSECPDDSGWGTAQLCQLQPTGYFEGCLANDAALMGCMQEPEQWTTACVAIAPGC